MDRMNNGDESRLNMTRECILNRKGILGCGECFTVALAEAGTLFYAGDNRWEQNRAVAWKDLIGVFCGPDYILGLGRDGTVIGAGLNVHGCLHVVGWAGVRLLACGATHDVALLNNGRVICAGTCDHSAALAEWRDMADVCCGNGFTVGVCRDGRVLVAGGSHGLRSRLSKWREIAAVFSDYEGKEVYGITADGRLIASCGLSAQAKEWKDLTYVAARGNALWGVTSHGTCLSDRDRYIPVGETDAWDGGDHLVVAAGDGHTVALQRNGLVTCRGCNDFGQCDMEWWEPLFGSFDAFTAARRVELSTMVKQDRTYQQRLTEAARYAHRLACGERMTACLNVDGSVSVSASLSGVHQWKNVRAISCGSAHLLALHRDGRVSAEGNRVQGCCDVTHWENVCDIHAGKHLSLGLTEDGQVLFAGWNRYGQGNVEAWANIRILRATDTYTVGLDREGKIHVAGDRLPFRRDMFDKDPAWQDLVDISVSPHHIAGLRRDGRVVFEGEGYCGSVECIKEKVSHWQGVRAIASGCGFVVGLCYGGHVVAAGRNALGQCETEAWRQIVAIGCGHAFTAGLCADGTVVTVGKQRSRERPGYYDPLGGQAVVPLREKSMAYAPCQTDTWKDVMAMACGEHHLVAVDRQGQLLATGLDKDGQCTATVGFVPFTERRQLDDYGRYLHTLSTVTK